MADNGTATYTLALTITTGGGIQAGFVRGAIANNTLIYSSSLFSGINFGNWGYETVQGGAVSGTNYTPGIWATGDVLILEVTAGSIQIKRNRGGTVTSQGSAVSMPAGTGAVYPAICLTSAGNSFTATFVGI